MPPKTTKQSAPQARRQSPRRAFSLVNSSKQLDRFYGDFGKRIRKLRQQQNLSQFELAEKAQISRSYLTQIEAGQRRISLHVAKNLATSMQLSLDQLLATE